MDAFAVSICKGLTVKKLKPAHMLIPAAYFGGFQGLMPLLGFLLGSSFAWLIRDFDHWIAFVLLLLIGGNMIRESFGKEEKADPSFAPKAMLPLAVATSIDALAVGITFSFLEVHILPAVLIISATTFCFSMAGIKIGNVFGQKFKSKAELLGGLVLIGIGVKILIEHIFFGG